MEAASLIQETQGSLRWHDLLARDPIVRRKALKQFGYRLPGRPLWVFMYLYLIRLGFLDGRAGFIYCILRAHYELMIDLKVLEIWRHKRGLPV